MNQIIEQLKILANSGKFQNPNLQLGVMLQDLYSFMKLEPNNIPNDIENLFIELLQINNHKISTINANTIGICLVLFYKSLKNPTYWNIFQFLSEEIQKQNISSIVVLGIISKHLGYTFKNQLPRFIQKTGTFLKDYLPEILRFVIRGAESKNIHFRIESLKTIPSLYCQAHYPFELLEIIIQSLSFSNLSIQLCIC